MDLAEKLQLKGRPPSIVGDRRGFQLPVPPGRSSATDPLIGFVATLQELETLSPRLVGAAQAERVTWVVYPKAGQLGTDLRRDSLASYFSQKGVQPVRSVSLSEVWTGLRLRGTAGVRARGGKAWASGPPAVR